MRATTVVRTTESNWSYSGGDLALILAATMRLTRLIVTDDLGQWWVKDPLDALFHPSERWYVSCGCGGHGDHLACEPGCIITAGCHHVIGVDYSAASEAEADSHVHSMKCSVQSSSTQAVPRWLARHVDHKYLSGLECPYCVGFHIGWMTMASYYTARRFGLLGPWRFLAGALALNEVAAHVGVKIGDFG